VAIPMHITASVNAGTDSVVPVMNSIPDNVGSFSRSEGGSESRHVLNGIPNPDATSHLYPAQTSASQNCCRAQMTVEPHFAD
jgi:hypothetical protein